MRLDVFQQLKLEQKMRLAPRMIQSMEILQMTVADLEERIEEELEKNPVLEIRETDRDAAGPESADRSDAETEEGEQRDLVVRDDNSNQDDFERLDNIGRVINPDDYAGRTAPRSSSFSEDDPKHQALANTAARDISLYEFLIRQWDLVEADPTLKQCGETIINYIEPNGYLRTDVEQLNATLETPVDEPVWEQALAQVQTLEPPGVAARSIQECLLLQLAAFGDERGLERLMIERYLEEFQKQQFTKIAQKTGRSLEQVTEAVEFIRTRLILHPGALIGTGDAPPIVPDVIVDYDDRGAGYVVIVPENRIPSLHISGYYRRMLHDSNMDKTTRHFIKNNVQSARWLIDAIEQRRATLKKVTEAIVEAQAEFLESGPKRLRPLPMAQVADKVGVHLATVSRAVSGKYVETPRGIYPLRMFFSGGTETSGGESLSWDAVRAKIRDIIDNEDKQAPHCDDKIVAMLKDEGIKLARRTVAKYRKVMGIPSSHRRKVS